MTLHRLIDQLYALQLVHRSNGANGYNIGVPVGFEREGRVYVYNHYRIIIYYHANSVASESPGVRVHEDLDTHANTKNLNSIST